MSRQQIIEREARQRPWVVAASLLPLVLYLAALIVESEAGVELSGLDTERLRTVDENSGALLVATILRAAGFVLMALPLAYLYRAAQARSDRLQPLLLPLVVLGPVLIGIQGIVGAVAERQVAADFVAQAQGVGDIYSLAENLRDDSGLMQAAAAMLAPGFLALIFGLIYTPLWGVRTGLLPRFFGTMGMALGASLLFLGGVALLIIAGWFAYLGMLILGRVRNGRPPAWDAGEAIPWLAPGEEPVAAAAGNGDVVEGDATEIPGVDESPHAARRERARRRKRKRRR